METSDVNGVKFGETSAHYGGGNPELSLGVVFTYAVSLNRLKGKCRDLTAPA